MQYLETIQTTITKTTGEQILPQNTFKKQGICKRMAIITPYNIQTGMILVKINDARGNLLLDYTPIELFKQRQGGTFTESLLPVTFNEKTIEVTFKKIHTLPQNYTISMAFLFNTPQQERIENQAQKNAYNPINSKGNCQF